MADTMSAPARSKTRSGARDTPRPPPRVICSPARSRRRAARCAAQHHRAAAVSSASRIAAHEVDRRRVRPRRAPPAHSRSPPPSPGSTARSRSRARARAGRAWRSRHRPRSSAGARPGPPRREKVEGREMRQVDPVVKDQRRLDAAVGQEDSLPISGRACRYFACMRRPLGSWMRAEGAANRLAR